MRDEDSSEDVRWRSFSESKDPDDQIWDWIMIDGESSKADDSESADLEIWLQLFWRLLDQNQSRSDSEQLH